MKNTGSVSRGKMMHDMLSFPLMKVVRKMVKQTISRNDVFEFNSDLVGSDDFQSILMYVSLNFLEKQYFLNIKAYKTLYLTITFFFGQLYISSQWITFDYLETL